MAYLASKWRRWYFSGFLGLLVAILAPAAPARAQGSVFVTDVQGAIGVAVQRQITQAIEAAQAKQAAALIVRLDTPGGLVSATRTIIQALIASPVPVIVYVAPSGAHAASAGTFIVYAAHVAAMARGTSIGAATPVEIGGLPGLPQPKDEKKDKQQDGMTTAQRKAVNDVVALLRGLAQLRGRNAEWAEKAVREAATLTAEEALKEHVIEIVASDLGDVLAQADGRKITVNGQERILATKDASLVTFTPDWRTRLLAVISDPNIAFILLMIGVYGILLEFWSPGTYVPGTVGAISLILGLMALTVLPVHYGALGLVMLGIALMVGEALTPGLGILGIGGILAFVVGAIFLFEGPGADISFAISLPLIIGTAAVTAALIFGVIAAALKARKRPSVTGAEQLIGSVGQVVDWHSPQGSVRLHGEIWAARSKWPLNPGDSVRVVGRDRLTLIVEP
ncbi:MAG: nodulation protein NfeD [Rhizobiales bacterium]|nr:nodulation protein NfeD [Hyphomicrobiales bacterium]